MSKSIVELLAIMPIVGNKQGDTMEKWLKDMIETRVEDVALALKTCNYEIAPFPLVGLEARMYLQGDVDALRWVLEML